MQKEKSAPNPTQEPSQAENIGVRLGYHFTTIPDCLIDDLAMSIYAKMIYIMLARHAGKEGTCWPSYATIAEKARCGRNSVAQGIKELCELGYLSKENRQKAGTKAKASNLYSLTFPSAVSMLAVQPEAPRLPRNLPSVAPQPRPRLPDNREVDSLEVDSKKKEEDFLSSKPLAMKKLDIEHCLSSINDEMRKNKLEPIGSNERTRTILDNGIEKEGISELLARATRIIKKYKDLPKDKATGRIIVALENGECPKEKEIQCFQIPHFSCAVCGQEFDGERCCPCCSMSPLDDPAPVQKVYKDALAQFLDSDTSEAKEAACNAATAFLEAQAQEFFNKPSWKALISKTA